jgi:hypothetical protein
MEAGAGLSTKVSRVVRPSKTSGPSRRGWPSATTTVSPSAAAPPAHALRATVRTSASRAGAIVGPEARVVDSAALPICTTRTCSPTRRTRAVRSTPSCSRCW